MNFVGENASDIKMGSMPKMWNEKAKTITFCVTEDCNLACTYCYLTGKNSKNRMTFEIAKQAVDYILSNREIYSEEAVVWEFIGGEPFLEIELIDKISDYIKIRTFELNHPWFSSYIFNFSTNGLLYGTEPVQNYIKKNKYHISIGISIDGNKVKHDLSRVRKDGSGSYDDVISNVDLWLRQFPNASTKSTFAHNDLPFLKDSIISLWDLGIKMVMANVVFEDVWYEGDEFIFENQLKELADYIIDKKLWADYSVRFFDHTIGFPLNSEELGKNYCGSGSMLAIDVKGNFYPCIRFTDFSLNNKKGLKIGDISKGLDFDKIRPFTALNLKVISPKECIQCEVGSGCATCTGCNYDYSDIDSIYSRNTFHCKMHKANVRATEYFWSKFTSVTKIKSKREIYREQRDIRSFSHDIDNKKRLFIILNNKFISNCFYKTYDNTEKMTQTMLDNSIEFAIHNNYIPILLGETSEYLIENELISKVEEKNIVLFDNKIEPQPLLTSEYCNLLININNIQNICSYLSVLFLNYSFNRVNLILEQLEKWDDSHINLYNNELEKVVKFFVELYINGTRCQLNVLTDILNLKEMKNCNCGLDYYTIAPNGKIYICPASYYDNEDNNIGDLQKGISSNYNKIFSSDNAPICSICDAYHCRSCKYLNKKLTGEYNTPSRIQCLVSHIERSRSVLFNNILKEEGIDSMFVNDIQPVHYKDPMELIKRKYIMC